MTQAPRGTSLAPYASPAAPPARGGGPGSRAVSLQLSEWGGFFEHVPPAEAPDVDPAFALRGFRVPCLLVSPFAARGAIATGTYDHTSVLKMIEWRWDLQPLSVRDAQANNLALALDFSRVRHDLPDYDVPDAVSLPCVLA